MSRSLSLSRKMDGKPAYPPPQAPAAQYPQYNNAGGQYADAHYASQQHPAASAAAIDPTVINYGYGPAQQPGHHPHNPNFLLLFCFSLCFFVESQFTRRLNCSPRKYIYIVFKLYLNYFPISFTYISMFNKICQDLLHTYPIH